MNPRSICVLLATIALACSARAALRVRQSSRLASTTPATVVAVATTTAAEDSLKKTVPEVTESAVEQPTSKHKRGILHGGAALGGAHWPTRTYAAHYGYSLQLPGAATFLAAAPAAHRSHGFVKYAAAGLPFHGGFHYKPYALAAAGATPLGTGAFLPTSAVGAAVGALPAIGGIASALAPAVAPAVATALAPAAPAVPAPSYVLRPGNALVSSYSVNYPHHHFRKPIVAGAVKPLHFHGHALQPTFVQAAGPALPALPSLPSLPSLPAVPSVGLQPVQPAVQTAFAVPSVQPVATPVPAAPVPASPPMAAEFPSFPQFPAFPQFPTFVSQVPQFPQAPQAPAVPQQPPTFVQPEAQFPGGLFPFAPQTPAEPAPPSTSQFFPANVQPPLPQQPPTFVQPEAQFPGGLVPLVPQSPAANVPGTPTAPPTSQFFPASVQPPTFVQPGAQFPGGIVPLPGSTPVQPETGTAIASPQIPNVPVPEADPEPTQPTQSQPQPQPQQPWRPVFFQPSTPSSAATPQRPSITLQPPYGRAPAEGYLPPVTSQSAAQLSPSSSQGHGIFDQLSDAEIEHIFAQANLAQQHHHHDAYQHY